MTTRFDPSAPLSKGIMLLEASAGTGKTHAITSLYLRFVLELGLEVDRILAVTFTNAATAELQGRIRLRLEEARDLFEALLEARPVAPTDEVLDHLVARIAEAPNDLSARELYDRAQRALERLDRARIATIHGFCKQLLQRHALDVGLPFGLELVEDEEALLDEVISDLWARLICEESLDTVRLHRLGGIEFESSSTLAKLHIRQPDARPTTFGEDEAPDPRPMLETLSEASALARTTNLRGTLLDFLASLHLDDKHDYPRDRALDTLEALGHGAPTRIELLRLAFFHRSRLCPERSDHTLPPFIVALSRLLDTHAQWCRLALPWLGRERLRWLAQVSEELAQRCASRRIFTHDALIRRLSETLRSDDKDVTTPLDRHIGGAFDAVLIDEFQDTDPTQWHIFHRLFGGGDHHLVLIGDPKQAIYSFRRADLRTYLEARRSASTVHTLDQNRRSDVALVDALNTLFLRDEGDEASAFAMEGILYQRVISHVAPAIEPACPPIRIAWLARSPRNVKSTNARNGRNDPFTGRISATVGEEVLPDIVASEIVETLTASRHIVDKGQKRPLRPSDLAVLVSTNRQAEAIEGALRRRGVPTVVHGTLPLFATEQAEGLLALLRATLEPSRPALVRRALVTKLLSLDLETLAAMEEGKAPELERWLDHLRRWRDLWTKRSFIDAFRDLMVTLGPRLSSRPDGEQQLSNLLELGHLLHQHALRHELGPDALLRYFASQNLPHERGPQVRLDTDEPAVHISTIHKAKGLEYPIVWCPFLWQTAMRWAPEPTTPFICRDEDGHHLDLGLDLESPARRRRDALRAYELRAERLRNLYVALTRARHELIVHAGCFFDLPDSPLGYLLFGGRTARDPISLEREKTHIGRQLGYERDDALLHKLQQRLPVSLFELALTKPASDTMWTSTPPERALAVRTYRRSNPLDTDFRRTSFSGLVAELDHGIDDSAAADEAPLELTSLETTTANPIALADFPSGRAFGNLVHKIFELHNFQDKSTQRLPGLIATELARYGLEPTLGPTLESAIERCLETPLDRTGFRLDEIPKSKRLTELSFVFPVTHRITTDRLVDIFRTHDDGELEPWLKRLERLDFRELHGFLSGSLDLAFVHPRDHRWYILDWKTNHLGRTAGDYTRQSMAEAMSIHHYHLQYHLYGVALRRYLRHRLGESFDSKRDFGGVYYLFIRGLDPSHPPMTGSYHVAPSQAFHATIDALDESLG